MVDEWRSLVWSVNLPARIAMLPTNKLLFHIHLRLQCLHFRFGDVLHTWVAVSSSPWNIDGNVTNDGDDELDEQLNFDWVHKICNGIHSHSKLTIAITMCADVVAEFGEEKFPDAQKSAGTVKTIYSAVAAGRMQRGGIQANNN